MACLRTSYWLRSGGCVDAFPLMSSRRRIEQKGLAGIRPSVDSCAEEAGTPEPADWT